VAAAVEEEVNLYAAQGKSTKKILKQTINIKRNNVTAEENKIQKAA
jgi:hypothetical protein